jgi:FdhE protein
VVGVVLADDRLRYLWCGLCATAWHHTRVQCTRCRSAARLGYLQVEGSDGTARAEQCDGCGAYLKLLHAEQAPALEPWADDLATLPLDLLMEARGSERLGVNLLLVPAAGGAATRGRAGSP